MLSDGVYYYSYDPDGNCIAQTQISNLSNVTYYQWNDANQLVGVSGGANATYSYDAFGRIVSQTENGTTQNFIYDGQNLALVLDGSGNVIERELYGPAVDQVLASEAAGAVSWYLGDNQGTVRDVVQFSGGADERRGSRGLRQFRQPVAGRQLRGRFPRHSSAAVRIRRHANGRRHGT